MISSALARLAGALLLLGGAADGQGTKKIVEVLDSDRPGGRQLAQVGAAWAGQTPQDLHREYSAIFHHGNRNAASHRWTTFLLERSAQMTEQRLELMFSGFCAVSGSPVRPVDYNRYRLTLPLVGGGRRTGYMHYCCWPCVCDTQDFIRIDTKNVTTADGTRQYHFAVLGNPCDHPEQLCAPSPSRLVLPSGLANPG